MKKKKKMKMKMNLSLKVQKKILKDEPFFGSLKKSNF